MTNAETEFEDAACKLAQAKKDQLDTDTPDTRASLMNATAVAYFAAARDALADTPPANREGDR